jgi:hypothetical protein
MLILNFICVGSKMLYLLHADGYGFMILCYPNAMLILLFFNFVIRYVVST